MTEIQRNVLRMVMACIQCICIFIIYAVFSTMVAEKRHDIGILLGIGASRRAIAGAFLTAGIIACLLGGALGWAIGWIILALLNPVSDALGIALFPQAVMYTPDAPISWTISIPLFYIGLMTLIGLIACILPALRASRIDPIDTLREHG